MRLAVNGAVDRERFLVVAFGLGIIALRLQGVGQGGQAVGDVRVAFAQGGAGDLHAQPGQRFRFLAAALNGAHQGQVFQSAGVAVVFLAQGACEPP